MQRITCKQLILEFLAEYLDDHLCGDALEAFERHLEGCAACRAYLATFRKTETVVRQAVRVEMPPEMKSHLRRLLLTHLGNGTH